MNWATLCDTVFESFIVCCSFEFKKRLKRQRFERYQTEQEAIAKRAKLREELDKWEKEEQLKQAAVKMVICYFKYLCRGNMIM